MSCFQHIPESCGALHSPCGGAPQQRGPLTPQTQTRPNRLHTHFYPSKRLAHPRSPIPPLSKFTSRATPAHPTSPRSTGFCAILCGIVLVRVRVLGFLFLLFEHSNSQVSSLVFYCLRLLPSLLSLALPPFSCFPYPRFPTGVGYLLLCCIATSRLDTQIEICSSIRGSRCFKMKTSAERVKSSPRTDPAPRCSRAHPLASAWSHRRRRHHHFFLHLLLRHRHRGAGGP